MSEKFKENPKIGTDFISLTKATKYCDYSGDYLKLRARQGKLKAVKIGRMWATKREWVEDYVREMEGYKENRRRQGEVKLDVKEREVKEVRPIRRISLFPEFELRPALALTLILLLLFSSIAFSKESFKNVLKLTISHIQETPKTITHVLKESKKSLASSLDSLNQSFINVAEVVKTTDHEDLKEPIPLFKEYFKWLGTNLKSLFVQKPKALVKSILNYGRYIAKKIRKAFKNLALEFQTKTKELKELVTKPWKIIPKKPPKEPEKPILAEVSREEFEKLKQEIEKLKEEGLPVREVVKEIEVSRITKVEPIKEITKEIKTLDDESLKIIQTALLQQETDVEKLKLAATLGYVRLPTILSLSGDTSIITLGTITTGSWQGNPITNGYITNDLTLDSTKPASISVTDSNPTLTVIQAGAGPGALIDNLQMKTGTIATTAGALTLDSASGTVQLAAGDSLTVPGTITVDGQLVATKAPTEAHTGTWSVDSGTWQADDATIYINPSSATGDSNLLGLAVNGFVKFAIDAEGDIFGNNLILEGSTSAATTTITGDLRVEGNTTLGDVSTDTLTFNASTIALPNNLNIDSDTLFIDASGNMVGIGTTGPNAKLEISPADANALRIGPFGAVAGNTGEIQLLELTANGTNYVGFKASDAITSNVIWTLPSTVGTAGYALTTDGAGILNWAQAGVNDATYLTLTYYDDLTAERVLTAGTNISITDGGANSTLTLATIVNPTFSTSMTSPIIYGSSAASGNLTLRSTSDVTKGYVLLADEGGDVGIGTTPSYKLDVSGDINFTGKLLEDGNEILANVIAVFNGSCPTSWTEVTEARGRAIVGTPLGGTNAGTVGAALSNLEDRTHSHGFTPSGTVSSSFTGTAGTTGSGGVNHTHSVPAHYHGFGAGSGLGGGSGTSGTQSANHTHTMAHTHSINPPATASGNPSANHTHSVNPPNTGTSSAGAHTHSYTQSQNQLSNPNAGSSSARYGQSAQTGSTGAHTHTVDIAAFNSGTVSAWHTHTTDIPAFTSGGSSAASTGGISASHTHSTPAHGHTGTIGLVTGGVSGNAAMTSGNASAYSHTHSFTPSGTVSSSFTGTAGTTGTASTSDAMPYIQLTLCQKDSGTDYAEWIESNEKIEEGMIVTVDPENDNKIVKSKTAYDKTILGIVSTKPGWLIGRESATAVKLTLSGQVPVKVTLVKGEIKRGDPITSSNIEGFGMKATKKGRVVGIALTELNHSSLGLYECGENMCGEVTVLLDLSWYDPNSLISKIITVIGLFIVYSLILLGGYQLWKKRKGKNITKIRR